MTITRFNGVSGPGDSREIVRHEAMTDDVGKLVERLRLWERDPYPGVSLTDDALREIFGSAANTIERLAAGVDSRKAVSADYEQGYSDGNSSAYADWQYMAIEELDIDGDIETPNDFLRLLRERYDLAPKNSRLPSESELEEAIGGAHDLVGDWTCKEAARAVFSLLKGEGK